MQWFFLTLNQVTFFLEFNIHCANLIRCIYVLGFFATEIHFGRTKSAKLLKRVKA